MWSKGYPMQVPARHIIDYDDVEGIDLDQSAADVAIFDIPVNGVILWAGLLVTEVVANDTTAALIEFDIRPTAGSDTERGEADAGSITIADEAAAGELYYDESAKGTRVNAGEQVVVQYTTKGVNADTNESGHVVPFLFIDAEFEMLENLDNGVEGTTSS